MAKLSESNWVGKLRCTCGHLWLDHNRFMGDGKQFGCIHCNCQGFQKEANKMEQKNLREHKAAIRDFAQFTLDGGLTRADFIGFCIAQFDDIAKRRR